MQIIAFDHIQEDLDTLQNLIEKAVPNSMFKGFTTFEDCFKYAKQNSVHLVFLENIEGGAWHILADTIRTLREKNPKMDFIIMHWSNIKLDEIMWATQSNISDFLQKPIEYADLLNTLKSLRYNQLSDFQDNES